MPHSDVVKLLQDCVAMCESTNAHCLQWLINNATRSESTADYSKLIVKHVLALEG